MKKMGKWTLSLQRAIENEIQNGRNWKESFNLFLRGELQEETVKHHFRTVLVQIKKLQIDGDQEEVALFYQMIQNDMLVFMVKNELEQIDELDISLDLLNECYEQDAEQTKELIEELFDNRIVRYETDYAEEHYQKYCMDTSQELEQLGDALESVLMVAVSRAMKQKSVYKLILQYCIAEDAAAQIAELYEKHFPELQQKAAAKS